MRRWGLKVARLVLTCAVIAGLVVALIRWLPLRYIVYAAFLVPVLELFLLIVGHLKFRFGWREAPDKFSHLIIQITTAGHEHDLVSQIIQQVRGYSLPMSHEIWVVTEPDTRTDYPQADTVLVVPKDFPCKAQFKGRAQEYSRCVRLGLGLARSDVKVLFTDDDVFLTKGYIMRAFRGDYDICQGVVSPRTQYAVRPLSHFLISHADDIRTHSCLVYCSVFQGIFRRPIFVHGEGLVVTGEAESKVTWNVPLISAEDLSFGQRAAKLGLRWGWFHEYAESTAPWTYRSFLVQRSRWLWGDIDCMTRRCVMPWSGAGRVSIKYLAGVFGLAGSAAGLYLRATGHIAASAGILNWAKLAALAWVGTFFACGWLAASTPERSDDSRMLAGVLAVLMMPMSIALTVTGVVIPLIQGNPRTFRVISKTREEGRKRFRMTWRKAIVGALALAVLIGGCTLAAHIRQLQPPVVPKSRPITLPSSAPPPSTTAFQRGVDIDAYTYRGQDTNAAAAADVAYIKGLHANAISISFPFFMNGASDNSVHATSATPTPEQLAVLVQAAQNAGLRVTLRPLLDESSFHHCRCGLHLAHPHQWFASYTAFLLPYARMAAQNHVSTFVVGTEFTAFSHSPLWGPLDRKVASVYHGTLECSDNWQVDPHGCGVTAQTVDAYHPILGNLLQGWEAYDHTFPLHSTLSEVGIDAVATAPIQPYRHHWPTTTLDPQVQARWFTAACHAAVRTHMSGVYFWSVGLSNPASPPTPKYQGGWGGAGANAVRACFASIERTAK